MGKPERINRYQYYQILHFPRGPAGSHTYFVYLDDNDHVLKWEQVLKVQRFDAIEPGMTVDEVVEILGATKITNGLARNRGYVWHYRYENHMCSSFVIEFTIENIVRSTEYRIRGGRTCKYVGP